MTTPRIHPTLAELIPALTAAGLSVYAYPGRPCEQLTWIVGERDGNTCVVSETRFDGTTVTACIRPTREWGSGVYVDIEPGEPETIGERVARAAIKATEPKVRVRFFDVNPIVNNDGMAHFTWAKLVKVAP